jgi:hypothetical protein
MGVHGLVSMDKRWAADVFRDMYFLKECSCVLVGKKSVVVTLEWLVRCWDERSTLSSLLERLT